MTDILLDLLYRVIDHEFIMKIVRHISPVKAKWYHRKSKSNLFFLGQLKVSVHLYTTMTFFLAFLIMSKSMYSTMQYTNTPAPQFQDWLCVYKVILKTNILFCSSSILLYFTSQIFNKIFRFHPPFWFNASVVKICI